MGQGQTVAPNTLPADFNQWDSSPDTLPANFSGFDQGFVPPEMRPENQPQGKFARFMQRATGVNFNAILNDPNATLNPFSSGYQKSRQYYAQHPDQANYPTFENMANAPIIPGTQTYQDVKAGNYAGALGDVTPGIIAFLQMRGAARSAAMAPEVMPKALPGSIQMPGEVSSEVSPPPYVSPTTRAQRLGLLLGQGNQAIELGPSSAVPQQAAEGVLPAARVQVRDRTSPTGLRDQYVTSVADPNQTLSINQGRALKTPYTFEEFKAIRAVRDLLEKQDGAGADEVDARMAQYAKSPWEKGNRSYAVVPEKVATPLPESTKSLLQQYLENRAALQPKAGDAPITVTPTQSRPIPKYQPQPAVPTSRAEMLDLLQKSLAMARARR